ncbi:MAG: polyprenol phosphomannose-dependent alpha 1,6 mannosyltransferase MptB [Gordonia sp. (in: high G+C Gram-positive bacteria)]
MSTPTGPRRILAGPEGLGLAGAVLVSVGGLAVADVPRNHPVLARVGLDVLSYGHAKTLGGTVFWLGIAAMVIAWVRIGRQLAADAGPAVATLRRTVIAWAVPLTLTVPLFSRDVYAYLGQGAVWVAGFNPYADGPAHHPGPALDSMAQVWASTTAPYGPAFMALIRGVSEICGDHVLTGVLMIRLVCWPGLVLSLWAIPRLAGHFGCSRAGGLWLVALNPMVLIHLVGGPHVELLMMGVLVSGVTLVVTGRHRSGLVVLGLAASIKVTAAVAIPFMLWIWLAHRRSRRPLTVRDVAEVLGAVVVIPVAVFAACTAATGLGLGWLTGLGFADQIINWFTIPSALAHLITLVVAPWQSLNLWPVLAVTRTIGAVVLALVLVVLWWRHRHDERSAMTGLVGAMLAVVLLEPSTLPWYYTWVLGVAVAVPLSRRVHTVVIGVSVFLLIVFQPDDSIVFYKAPEVALALALSALAGWSYLREDPLRVRVAARRAWG